MREAAGGDDAGTAVGQAVGQAHHGDAPTAGGHGIRSVADLDEPTGRAPDTVATLVARALPHGVEVVIVTGDKDLLQLVSPRVKVLSVIGRTGRPPPTP